MQWLLLLKTQLISGYQTVATWFRETLHNLWYVASQSFKILVIIIVILLLPIWLMTRPIDTHIQVDLVVNGLSFRVEQQPLEWERLKFHSATVSDFQQIEFTTLENTPKSITSKSAELFPTVLLETANPTTTEFGILQDLTIEPPAKVTLAVEKSQVGRETLVIAIEEAQDDPAARLLHPKAFKLTTDQCEGLASSPLPVPGLPRRNPYLTVTGKGNALKMILTTPTLESFSIFQKNPEKMLVKELEFISEDLERGRRVAYTTLLTEGVISYPEYPKIEPVTFTESNFVWLDKMDNFYIEQIGFDSEKQGLKIRLTGEATAAVETYPQGFSSQRKDHRLTMADTLGQGSPFVGVMLSVLIYIIPIIIGLVAIGKVEIVPRPKPQTQGRVTRNSENREEE